MLHRPILDLRHLTPAQQDDVRKAQADLYDEYESWINHPFNKRRWHAAYTLMHHISAARDLPGYTRNPLDDARYLMAKEIVNGEFDSEVFFDGTRAFITAAAIENHPAAIETATLARQGSSLGLPTEEGPARVIPDYVRRGTPN